MNHEVYVTNKNAFHHADRYNGQDYDFPMGEKVLLPIEAARHMLGYGTPDKTEALVRLGWANMHADAGVQNLARFVFTQAVTVEMPVSNATGEIVEGEVMKSLPMNPAGGDKIIVGTPVLTK